MLFADLRGYTGLAERLEPSQLVPLLDEFFGVLAEAVTSHGGTVFHMAGDGMMAGFGARDLDRSGAREALAAGRCHAAAFWRGWQRGGAMSCPSRPVSAWGLHLGDVAMGVMGPRGQKFTTLVGDTVNVAARFCARARGRGEVLLSHSVAAALSIEDGERELYVGPIPVLHLPQFALRGRSAPMDIWCVPALERVAF